MSKLVIISALLAVSFNLFGQQAIQPLSPLYTEEHSALAEELMLSFAPKKQDFIITYDADEAWKNWTVIENSFAHTPSKMNIGQWAKRIPVQVAVVQNINTAWPSM
ncbi:MAG: hypothetical protein MUF39_13205 [Cyclobacteriaceae bacterium]|nr:hypothetical protein [Cyclobacteriaceae bacterium]